MSRNFEDFDEKNIEIAKMLINDSEKITIDEKTNEKIIKSIRNGRKKKFTGTYKMATAVAACIVLVAGMITMYTSADGVFYKYLIPVYGSSMAFKDILTREITMTNFLGTTISTYLYAVIIVAVMTKAFNSEKVMFNA